MRFISVNRKPQRLRRHGKQRYFFFFFFPFLLLRLLLLFSSFEFDWRLVSNLQAHYRHLLDWIVVADERIGLVTKQNKKKI